MPPHDFAKSNFVIYQFFEMSKRETKTILSEIDELIVAGYGSYAEMINLTYREIADIQIVRVSKVQESQLENVTK